MSTPTNYLVTSMNSWVSQDFEQVLPPELTLIRDYGLNLPPVPASTLAGGWMSAAHATRLKLAGYNIPFTSPGPQWMSRANPDLTGRQIITTTVKEAEPAEGFWKIAEAKHHTVEAAWRTKAEAADILALLPLDSYVQYTNTFLDILSEDRFFVYLDGTGMLKVSGSTYRKGNWTYYDDLAAHVDVESHQFAYEVAVRMASYSPASYALDVAVLRSGERVVLEVNPVWCSAPYADTQAALQATLSSIDADSSHLWVPDASLVVAAQKKHVLT